MSPSPTIRLGLCCQLLDSPIKFRTATAAVVRKLTADQRAVKLDAICQHNAVALLEALQYCVANSIGCFRINSQILPLKTHPEVGYRLPELPNGLETIETFLKCGRFAFENDLRLSFHPDQFVVLSSPHEHVVNSSLAEIEYQAEVAEWTGADVINIHGGGAYGEKSVALSRLRRNADRLSERARSRLTLENDDRTYSPVELLTICMSDGIPLVYDVHHHRCLQDGQTVEEATQAAIGTWNREPMFHVSSPRNGWQANCPHYHADFIDPSDFPPSWRGLTATVEIEAKAKQHAVAKLRTSLNRSKVMTWKPIVTVAS